MKVMVVSLFYQVNSYPIVKGLQQLELVVNWWWFCASYGCSWICNSRTNLWVSRFWFEGLMIGCYFGNWGFWVRGENNDRYIMRIELGIFFSLYCDLVVVVSIPLYDFLFVWFVVHYRWWTVSWTDVGIVWRIRGVTDLACLWCVW